MSRPPTRLRKLLLWSILGLWTLVLMEALAAGYFLWFARTYYRPLYLEQRSDQWLWRTEHHDWGPWHKPSSTATHIANCFSVRYSSNSHGARDRERSLTAAAPRAVFLGDSFIEGYGVDEDERVSNLLERDLGFEVLNFGMTHFGPLQYELIYEKLARQFEHDLVIVGVLPNNDFWENDADFNREFPEFESRYRPYYAENGGVFYPRPRPTPGEPSYFEQAHAQYDAQPKHRTLRQKLSRLFWLYGLNLEIRWNVNVLRHPEPAAYVGYFESDTTRISRVTGSLLAIQEAAAPRPVLVLFIPDYKSWAYVEEHAGAYEKAVVHRMRDVLESRGVKTLDLLGAFMEKGLDKASLFLPCDGHWNGAGHRAAFEVVNPVVRDLLETAARGRSAAAPPGAD